MSQLFTLLLFFNFLPFYTFSTLITFAQKSMDFFFYFVGRIPQAMLRGSRSTFNENWKIQLMINEYCNATGLQRYTQQRLESHAVPGIEVRPCCHLFEPFHWTPWDWFDHLFSWLFGFCLFPCFAFLYPTWVRLFAFHIYSSNMWNVIFPHLFPHL